MQVTVTTTPETIRNRNPCTGEIETYNLDVAPKMSVTLSATCPEDREFLLQLVEVVTNAYRNGTPAYLALETTQPISRIPLTE